MKKIILSFPLFCFLLGSACQSNDFKFKGKMPKGQFFYTEMDNYQVHDISVDSLPARNRVYLIFDTSGQILLNGHLSSFENFKEDLSYVLTNPDQLEHLPERFSDAIVCINFPIESIFKEDKVQSFKVQYVSTCLTSLYQSEISNYLQKNGYKNWNSIDSSIVALANEKIRLNIAIPRIEEDKGIRVELPPWSEEEVDIENLKTRNVMSVLVNDKNEVLIRDKKVSIDEVRQLVKNFISNPDQSSDLAESPTKAIISLKNDRGTNYKTYLAVYNNIKAAYNELWDVEAKQMFGKKYDALPRPQQKEIRQKIPLIISEAEPTGF